MKRAQNTLRKTAICAAVALNLVATPTNAADENEALVRSLAECWRANRESFTQFTCLYRRIEGTAGTREEALRGELRDFRSVEVLWLVDGEKERCSMLVDDAALREVREDMSEALRERAASEAGRATQDASFSGFLDETYLAFGDIHMHGNSIIGGMTLYGPEFPPDESGNDIATPFSMGVMGPGATLTPAALVERWLDEKRPLQVGSTEGPSGSELVSVRLGYEDGSYWVYGFSPERGCLTEQILEYDAAGNGMMELLITDIQECSNSRWFPMRVVRMDGPVDRPDEQRFVIILEVLELDVDSAPPADAFAVTFAARSHVNERSDARSQFYLSEPMTVTPENLPDLLARAKAHAEQHRTYEAAQILAQEPQRKWLTIATIAILTLLAGGFVARHYWRRASR